MSRNSMIKSGFFASACVAGLTLSACASSQNSSSRYGSLSEYEGGGYCNTSPCGPTVGAAPVVDSRYGSAGGQTVHSENVVYADCSQVGGMNCGTAAPAPVYTAPAPAPVYTQQQSTTYTAPATTQYAGPITCPAGTKDAGDGTCMQISSTSTYTGSTYSGSSSSTSYPSTSYSSTTTSSSYNTGPVDCPVGTKDAGDGTCMMSSGSSLSSLGSSSSSSSAYTGSSAVIYGSSGSSATQYADCPAGSVRSASGSCTVSGGYAPSSTYTPPTTYMPIRK